MMMAGRVLAFIEDFSLLLALERYPKFQVCRRGSILSTSTSYLELEKYHFTPYWHLLGASMRTPGREI